MDSISKFIKTCSHYPLPYEENSSSGHIRLANTLIQGFGLTIAGIALSYKWRALRWIGTGTGILWITTNLWQQFSCPTTKNVTPPDSSTSLSNKEKKPIITLKAEPKHSIYHTFLIDTEDQEEQDVFNKHLKRADGQPYIVGDEDILLTFIIKDPTALPGSFPLNKNNEIRLPSGLFEEKMASLNFSWDDQPIFLDLQLTEVQQVLTARSAMLPGARRRRVEQLQDQFNQSTDASKQTEILQRWQQNFSRLLAASVTEPKKIMLVAPQTPTHKPLSLNHMREPIYLPEISDIIQPADANRFIAVVNLNPSYYHEVELSVATHGFAICYKHPSNDDRDQIGSLWVKFPSHTIDPENVTTSYNQGQFTLMFPIRR
jgi:hypothetical protein